MCSTSSDRLTALRSLLSGLAGEDLKGMFGPQVLDRTAALVAAHNMLSAELARTAREGELTQAPEGDGIKSMPSWLRGHQRLVALLAGVRRLRTGIRGRRLRRCPWSRRADVLLVYRQLTWEAKGVRVVGVACNANESETEIRYEES